MDANATTPLLPEVFEAMRPFWMEHYGNASSIHQQGQQARGAVEQARTTVARFLHCLNSEIVFTSGGTESDNLALFGVLSNETAEPAHLITTTIEHHAVLHAAESLEKRGLEVTYLAPTRDGVIDPADASHRAVVAIGQIVQKQAYILAFSDTFFVLGVALIIALVATLLLKKLGHIAPGGGAHPAARSRNSRWRIRLSVVAEHSFSRVCSGEASGDSKAAASRLIFMRDNNWLRLS